MFENGLEMVSRFVTVDFGMERLLRMFANVKVIDSNHAIVTAFPSQMDTYHDLKWGQIVASN